MRTRHPMWALQLTSQRLFKPLITTTGMPYLTFNTKKEALAHTTQWNIKARPVKIMVTVQVLDVWG